MGSLKASYYLSPYCIIKMGNSELHANTLYSFLNKHFPVKEIIGIVRKGKMRFLHASLLRPQIYFKWSFLLLNDWVPRF